VRTQLGVFYMDYQDMQMNVVDPNSGTNSTGNADESTIKGAELQLQSRFGSFSADLNFSFVDSVTGGITLIDVRSLPGGSTAGLGPQCAPGQIPPGCFDYTPYQTNLEGQPTPYAPEITANLGLEYGFVVGGGMLTPRLDVTHISEQFSSLFAGTFDRIPSRTLANVSLSLDQGPWHWLLAVTNVTDETYVSGIEDASGNMWIGAPLTARLSMSREF
jgi:iron complex outermembrane receptor protein